MLKAFLRFLIFFVPVTIWNGISFILFDNIEIVGVDFNFKKRKKKTKKEVEQNVLLNYLKKCHKDSGDYGVNDGEKKADK